ncbi:MAG: Fe2+-dependent dioxygenase [Gammaproteobacteria bacterium]|nr:Fe2+-dependent dioxygenase [Gammaproteobacteria bacterium]
MLIQIPSVLDQNKIENIRSMLDKVDFVDGKLSAGLAAKPIKHNLESVLNQKQSDYLDQLVMRSLAEHTVFQNGALPHQVSQPIFARYTQGMQYGDHIDDPIMGSAGGRFRCDIAVTLFISDNTDYEGGELVINTAFGLQKVKLSAGDAVLYPASSIHHVNEVISGARLVSVCWIQSLIRDPTKRELLFNLEKARSKLMLNNPETEETKQIDHTYVNLVRMWSEF